MIHKFSYSVSLLLISVVTMVINTSVYANPSGSILDNEEATNQKNYKVGITLTALRDIDDAHSTFYADFYISISWYEEGCAKLAAGDAERSIIQTEEAWETVQNPHIEFINAYGSEDSHIQDADLIVHNNGICTYSFRYSGLFRSQMDLRHFPFDHQKLKIIIESSELGISMLRLVPGRFNDIENLKLMTPDLPDWEIDGVSFDEGIGEYPYLEDSETSYSRLTFTVDVTRQYNHYIWKFLLPLVIIVMLSWTVFWIGPEQLESQMQVSISCVFSVIAFNFITAGQLPRIGYLTVLDLWVLLSYIFVSAGAIENTISHYLISTGRKDFAEKVDQWSRILFPVAYFILTIIILIRSLMLN